MPLLTTQAGVFRAPAGSGYTGLGDIVSGALFYWGLRAYNAAKATAGADCIDIVDNAGSFTATLGVQSDGNLNVTVIKAGALAGSSLATWVSAHGTAYVHKVYDQIGSYHATSVAVGPELDMTLHGGKGGFKFTSGAALVTSATMTQAQPYSAATVAARTGSTAGNDGILGTDSAYPCLLAYDSGVDKLGLYLGSANVAINGVTEGTSHAVQWICNGTSTIVNFDGTDSGVNFSTSNPGAATITGSKLWMADRAGGGLTGRIAEICMWSGVTSYNSAIKANQKTWWGTP